MGWEVACACEGVWVRMPGGVEDRDGGLTRAEGEAMTPGVVTKWYLAPGPGATAMAESQNPWRKARTPIGLTATRAGRRG